MNIACVNCCNVAMSSLHHNDRGSHTSVTEASLPVRTFFAKNKQLKVSLSPGKIEQNVGAKSKSLKFKHINNEVYEMVVTHNGSRQEFKVFTHADTKLMLSLLKADKKLRDWNINYTDMRQTRISP